MTQLPGESTDDFFARLKRQDEQFSELIATMDMTDIFGVVTALGASSAQIRNEPWQLVFRLTPWKTLDHSLCTEELRVEMPKSRDETWNVSKQIQAYDIVHVKARVGAHPRGHLQALMTELVSLKYKDAELEKLAAELQNPVTIQDDFFGTLTLNRRLDWFECEADWQGRSIPLTIDNREPDGLQSLLDIAKELWTNQDAWMGKALDYAAAELLDLKNEAWLDEGESPVTAAQFKSCMTLTGVGIMFNGTFDLNFDDGDLFWGHEIGIEGTLAGGMTKAEF